LIRRELKNRIFQILNKGKTNRVHEHIYTFNNDGTRSYYLNYSTKYPGADVEDGFRLFLESQQVACYLVGNLIDSSVVDQIISDILDTELVAKIMEVDVSLRGWNMTENVGIGIANPRCLKSD